MNDTSARLIDLLVAADVLRFGDFTTKSGRRTPFFIDMGRLRTGAQLSTLGALYAEAIDASFGADVDLLFGPAYKGIPIASATAVALARDFGRDVPFAFDRKEVKDHGEGGQLVGQPPRDGDRVLIVEDVTTAGTSVRESIPKLRAVAPGCEVVGLVVSVDRQERGATDRGALPELADEFGLRTVSLATLDDVVTHLHGREVDGRVILDDEVAQRIADYRAEYGAR